MIGNIKNVQRKWGGKMKRDRVKMLIKIVLAVLVAGIVLYLSIRYLIPLSRLLATEGGREQIYHAVEAYGIFAPIVFAGLMALQIVIAFIPGGPLELIAGMLFGGVRGTIYTMLGAVAGTSLVYLLVKCFGRPLVHFFVSEERIQKYSILQDERRLEFWVFVLFLIPGIPKDLLTYIVPLTKMRAVHFILLSSIARFPAIVISVFMGDSITQGRYWLCVVIAIAAAITAFIGLRVKTRILKDEGEKS